MIYIKLLLFYVLFCKIYTFLKHFAYTFLLDQSKTCKYSAAHYAMLKKWENYKIIKHMKLRTCRKYPTVKYRHLNNPSVKIWCILKNIKCVGTSYSKAIAASERVLRLYYDMV